jgi:RNA polymerase sigma-70 factor (ECF subfamily)
MLSGTPVPILVAGASSVASQRDRGRLESMFTAHHETVWRVMRRRGLAPEAAADATQQCFLIAAERLGDIRAGSERAFLLATALRVASTASRSSQRWQLEDDMDQREALAHQADELADRRRAVDLMDRVLAKLDPPLLEVFVLFEIEGLSTPEIAKMIGIPLGTAASRLRRGREAFRAVVARLEKKLRREVER